MTDEFPKLVWQREYNGRWIVYSYSNMWYINRALERKQKTVSIRRDNWKRNININLEKMIEKNLETGIEYNIRCLVFNKSHIYWSWKDDCDVWRSYVPRAAFFLEVAFEKKLKKVDIFVKDDYEVNLEQFIQVSKETQYVYSILREEVEVSYPFKNRNIYKMFLKNKTNCEELIKKKMEESINSLQNYLFDLPVAVPGPSNSCTLYAAPDEIILALNIESQTSPSVPTQNLSLAVDPNCPRAKIYIVYCEKDDIYNATLNFTCLQSNINKFCIIQLLKYRSRQEYAVWFRCGRVGYKGRKDFVKCGKDLKEAKSVFEAKFFEKTSNHWYERRNFKKISEKYDLVHVDLCKETSRPLPSAETKLDVRIQNLLQIICNRENLEVAAKELYYDSRNTPLGRITAKQILKGYSALKKILAIIEYKGKGKELVEACSDFYTKIPHACGSKTLPVLSTLDQVKTKLKMLEDLSNMCIALDVLNWSADHPGNIIDNYYRSLECLLIPLEHTSAKFEALKESFVSTLGNSCCTLSTELIDAFICVKHKQESSFLDFGNKKLLWHGSGICNWIGILKKGLQIAPPEAPSNGYMFGKGIYFSDSSTKSCHFCFPLGSNNEGLLLLCEVSLGNALPAVVREDLSNLPFGYNSVFGIGKAQPKEFIKTVLSSEAYTPCGPLEENMSEDLSLNYNEYVVYNVNQVKLKYILRLRFKFATS